MPQKPKSDKSKGKGSKLKAVTEESGPASEESKATRDAFENLGELPHGYGVDTIFLVAQEPHWLFTYWDIDIAKHPGGAAILRYHNASGLEGEIEVPFETRNWYVPVQHAAMEYHVEIGFYRGKNWNAIARSVPVTTPPEGMATTETFDYATIPFHLSFQRLLDNLENAARSGEDLLTAVARLQQNGDFSAFGGIGFQELLSEDQRTLLNVLLGPDLATELSSGTFSSGEIESRIRAFIEEHLSSAGPNSEFLSSFRDTAGAFSSGAFSSETVASSWDTAGLSSWAASMGGSWSGPAFASWLQAALTSWSQATTSSWSAGGESSALVGGESSGSLAAMSSWLQGLQSSWLQGGESSGSLVAITSWLQGVQSSWLQGIQSSWSEAAVTSWTSSEVSSWLSGLAESSWSGASETLSSFDGKKHANGEVVFYGGTDPRVKVTINGQPIPLNPDGTFRLNFIFPAADCKIDIVAE